jgi:hypothetical protein
MNFHVPVSLLITQYLCLIYPNKSNDCHSYSLTFTIIFVNIPLKWGASLQCVWWTEEKLPKVILQYSYYLNKYKSTLLEKTTKLYMKKIIHFFPPHSRQQGNTQWGRCKYYIRYTVQKREKFKHDLCDIWLLATMLKSVASETSTPASTSHGTTMDLGEKVKHMNHVSPHPISRTKIRFAVLWDVTQVFWVEWCRMFQRNIRSVHLGLLDTWNVGTMFVQKWKSFAKWQCVTSKKTCIISLIAVRFESLTTDILAKVIFVNFEIKNNPVQNIKN